jgi:hypothetical protein
VAIKCTTNLGASFKRNRSKKNLSNVPNSKNANVVEHETKLIEMVSKLHIEMITKLHIAASTMSNDWWHDSGATIHVFNNKNHFKDHEVAKDG